MKNFRFAIGAMALFLAFTGCKKDEETPGPTTVNLGPIASFIYTGGDCGAPCAVEFHNSSSNSVSYTWDFGDGSPISEEATTTVKHTYDSVGTYLVKLTAIGENNMKSSKVLAVKVSGPEANFSVQVDQGMGPYSIMVHNQSRFANSFTLDFGDGTQVTDSVYWQQYHTYEQSGTYTVTLTAKNQLGNTNSLSKTVVIEGNVGLENITRTSFKLTGFTIDNGMQIMDFYSQFPACEKDDLHKFDLNNNYTRTDAGITCNPSSASSGSWYFQNNQQLLYLNSYTSIGGDFTIVSLTSSQLVIRKSSYFYYPFYQDYGTGTYTFTAQ